VPIFLKSPGFIIVISGEEESVLSLSTIVVISSSKSLPSIATTAVSEEVHLFVAIPAAA